MSDEDTVVGGEGTEVEISGADARLLGLGEGETMDPLPEPAEETETPTEETTEETPVEETETPVEPEEKPKPADPKPTPAHADTPDWGAKKGDAEKEYREAEAELAKVHAEMDRLAETDDLIPAKVAQQERKAMAKMNAAQRAYSLADEEIANATQRSVEQYWSDFASKNPDIGADKGKELAGSVYADLQKEFPNASMDSLSVAATREFNARLKSVRDGMKGAQVKKGQTPPPKPIAKGSAQIRPTTPTRTEQQKPRSVAEKLQQELGDASKAMEKW